MEFLVVIAAALAAFAFGAVCYIALSKPSVAMNHAYAMRKPALTLIDGVNSVVGYAIIGAALNVFQGAKVGPGNKILK